MATPHRPRKGSMGYSPRKRASREFPKIHAWPEGGDKPTIQGFVGYKAGMTHAMMLDSKKTSMTEGQEISIPITVVETPPMKVVAARFYQRTHYGLKTISEIWTEKIDEEMSRKIPLPKEKKKEKKSKDKSKNIDTSIVEDVRILAHTQPKLVTGVPKKKPEIMEIRIGGGKIAERIEFAKSLLGKDLTIGDFAKVGKPVDVIGVTKGKGFQGHVQRWGVKLLSHKNSKHRRMIGTQGPWHPNWVMSTVPQAGQMGYHQRTEFNKRILKVGEKGEEITPSGGFLNYGIVRNPYVLIHGSIPGPVKRAIKLRDAIRFRDHIADKVELTYISLESKQGA
ncbi:MAG: 50S ribosomal protein L3 [Thermoplasmata archaeon]